MKFSALLLLVALPFLEASPLGSKKTSKAVAKPVKATVSRAAPIASPTKKVSPTTKKVSSRTIKVSATASTKTRSGYYPLKPTSGCTPKKCGKTKCRRDDDLLARSNLLPREDAPVSPTEKTDAGLSKWTKDVWASSPKDLDLGSGANFKPTSHFFKWSQLGTSKFVTVKGLYGCTSVVVVSDVGVWMSHHWQNTVEDHGLDNMFKNAFTNALQNKGLAVHTPSKEDLMYDPTQKEDVESMYPAPGASWKPLSGTGGAVSDASKPFDAAANPKAAVVVWEGTGTPGGTFTKNGPKMAGVVKDAVPAVASVKLVKYKNAPEAREASESKTDHHGKVIVSYDSATKKYQVWVGGHSVTAPVLMS